MPLTRQQKIKFYKNKKKIAEVVVDHVRRKKHIIFGARSLNAHFPKFLDKPTVDYDILVEKGDPKKVAKRIERKLDKKLGGNYFVVEAARHPGTYKVKKVLGFEGGMRISEIVGYQNKIQPLNKKQIEGNTISVIGGKGGKDRKVPKPKRINQKAIDMLPLTVSRRALQKYVTDLARRVLDKTMTFHTLRHGFVTHLVNQGRPLHEVQMLAGHSRLDTTGIYLHANPQKAIEGAREAF